MYLDNNDFVSWMEKLSAKLNEIGKDLKAAQIYAKIIKKKISQNMEIFSHKLELFEKEIMKSS